eukprot:513460_1
MSDEKCQQINAKPLQAYARVRCLTSWESKKVSLSINTNNSSLVNKYDKGKMHEYHFAAVFDESNTNRDCFEIIAVPLIRNTLRGFNSVLITYGQTGSGKTYSIVGNTTLKIKGILQLTLSYICKQNQVTKVELSAIESFGHHPVKTRFFDLFAPENQITDWQLKTPLTTMDIKNDPIKVLINNEIDAHNHIMYAHAASHFANTGFTTHSSRGHITFIIAVHMYEQHEISYFIMFDSGGCDGETALSQPPFKESVSKTELLCRRLEAGCINTGLSQIGIALNELKKNGKLKQYKSHYLSQRVILQSFIHPTSNVSVLFTLSPNFTYRKVTESVLKFASRIYEKPDITQDMVVFGWCKRNYCNLLIDVIFIVLQFYKFEELQIPRFEKDKYGNWNKYRNCNIKSFGRVRNLIPSEPRKVSLQICAGNKLRNRTRKIVNEYQFNELFGINICNENIFEDCMEWEQNDDLSNGYNLVYIVYGGKKSGKCFTLIGNKKMDGILQLSLKELVQKDNVTNVELCAIEVFGNNPNKIEIFDLFDEINKNKKWKNKKGSTSFNIQNVKKICITND